MNQELQSSTNTKATTAPIKSSTQKKAAVAAPAIKATPVNSAWAIEVAKAYGLAGPLADRVAENLVKAVSEHLEKITQPQRLTKLIKKALGSCIGQIN